jgi:hypothetical protein
MRNGHILSDCLNTHLVDENDLVGWKFGKNNRFTVKSTYDAMTDSGYSFKHIWKGKVPAKIKIFLWLVENNAILTKDNMLKRRWKGDASCYFCDSTKYPSSAFYLLCGKGCLGLCCSCNWSL